MTPAAEWTHYLEVLLATDQDSAVHEVASRVDALGRTSAAAEYLQRVIAQNAEKTRVFEVSWDLLALMTGVPA